MKRKNHHLSLTIYIYIYICVFYYFYSRRGRLYNGGMGRGGYCEYKQDVLFASVVII